MKKFALCTVLFALLLFSCAENNSNTSHNQQATTATMAGLELLLKANPEWEYENLRLYPVCATAEALQANASLPALQTLSEGMQTPGFRITERKQFGREQGAWYNALTVQNKSAETVFLMSGDVVTGGNQDRVIAYDDVIPPGTVKNIEVFCVEAGRSSYYDPEAPDAEKRIAAFRGYYNVASPQVRNAVYAGNQQGVWNAVAQVTDANNASSNTRTYAALETENEQKTKREAYLRFFEGKFAELPNVVGVVAVCKGKVIGVDIFGQPELFRGQYTALVHSYAAEAATAGQTTATIEDKQLTAAFQQVAGLTTNAGTENAGKFVWGEAWVHLFRK